MIFIIQINNYVYNYCQTKRQKCNDKKPKPKAP